MTNINGKAYAMNAITPMEGWKTPILRILFFLLGAIKSKPQDLINLSFIHFARWVIVKSNQFPAARTRAAGGTTALRLSVVLQQL